MNKKHRKKQKYNLPVASSNQSVEEGPKVQNGTNSIKKSGFRAITQSFEGPVPPPQIVEAYDKIYPGAAKIIFDMAQDQAKHRQALETKVIESDIKNSKIGMWFGLIAVTLALIAAGFCAYIGQGAAAIAIGGTSIASLAAVFVYGTKSRKEERAQKRSQRLPSGSSE